MSNADGVTSSYEPKGHYPVGIYDFDFSGAGVSPLLNSRLAAVNNQERRLAQATFIIATLPAIGNALPLSRVFHFWGKCHSL